MKSHKAVLIWTLVVFSILTCALLWAYILDTEESKKLNVTFFDVGQGDAIFIETPNGTQVLIDGGKGKTILRKVGGELSFFDRYIDMVIATHPDLDHIGGLPYVFNKYEVGKFVHSGVNDDGDDNRALLQAIAVEGLEKRITNVNNKYILDEGIYIEILFPDRDVRKVDANVGSIVAKLVYGDTSFMFTGDAPTFIEEHLVSMYGESLESTVLKLGHHGSKTSSSLTFLGYVNPDYAVISASCNNSYGHPHKEVLDSLERLHIEELRTCNEGDIAFSSDGEKVYKK